MTIIQTLVGMITGILSGCGIGGGSLLVLYLTAIADVAQRQAGGINLMYFIACAPAALIGHIRHKAIAWPATIWCVVAGVITAAATALLTQGMDTGLLRQLFGGLLLYVGVRELFYKKNNR